MCELLQLAAYAVLGFVVLAMVMLMVGVWMFFMSCVVNDRRMGSPPSGGGYA